MSGDGGNYRAAPYEVLAAPGARRQARKLTVTCLATGCCLGLLFLAGAIVVVSVAIALVGLVNENLRGVEMKSRIDWAKYNLTDSNSTGDAAYDGVFVTPLIKPSDHFDVEVTLWLGTPVDQFIREGSQDQLEGSDSLQAVKDVTPTSADSPSVTKEAIWSDVLFRNQTLLSPMNHAEVPVYIAKDRLKHWNATHGSLQASFIIRPHLLAPPSTLQVVRNHSVFSGYQVGIPAQMAITPSMEESSMRLAGTFAPLLMHPCPRVQNGSRSCTSVFIKRTRVGIISDQVYIPRPALLHRRRAVENDIRICATTPSKETSARGLSCMREIKDFPVEVELEMKDNSAADAPSIYVWAPRLQASPLGHSLSEVHKIRKNLTSSNEPGFDQDIDFNWKVSFGPITAKQAWADVKFGSHSELAGEYLDSIFSPVSAHVLHEVIASETGDSRHPDAKPRRRLALYVAATLMVLLSDLLTVAYWYTRSSTAGISLMSCYLKAANFAGPIYSAIKTKSILDGIFGPMFFFCDAMAIWLALHLQLQWRGVLPILGRLAPLKAERDSQRLEARYVKLQMVALAIILTTAFRYFCGTFELLPATGVGRDTTPSVEKKPWSKQLEHLLLRTMVPSIETVSEALQLLHNHRSGTFAGQLRLKAYLHFAWSLLVICQGYVTVIRGYSEHRDPFQLWMLLDLFINTVGAWQAFTLPAISQVTGEDDDVVALSGRASRTD